MSEKAREIAEKVPPVPFVKYTIVVYCIRKNHVTLYTNLPCSPAVQYPPPALREKGNIMQNIWGRGPKNNGFKEFEF
jgi:hypothetical protein